MKTLLWYPMVSGIHEDEVSSKPERLDHVVLGVLSVMEGRGLKRDEPPRRS